MDHKEAYEKIKTLKANLALAIKGKPEAIDLTLTALLARGHLLIEDVPGVGKTTLAHALAGASTPRSSGYSSQAIFCPRMSSA
jgi:MoxR-like ATPase